jgi:hypothetical protein
MLTTEQISALAEETFPIDEKGGFMETSLVKYSRNVFTLGYTTAQESGSLKWKIIDPDNLPDSTVVAAWKNGTGAAIMVWLENWNGKVALYTDTITKAAFHPTHYILLSDLLNLPTE